MLAPSSQHTIIDESLLTWPPKEARCTAGAGDYLMHRCSSLACMQVFVPSKDGKVKIPMFIVHRNDVKLDGSNPTYLYAYGGDSALLTCMSSELTD